MSPDKTYKASLRIPTEEQYAYLEIHHEGTIQELLEAYNEATRAVKVGIGLEVKEWNGVLDKYRSGKGIEADMWERCNKAQAWLLHELDKSDSRLKGKEK